MHSPLISRAFLMSVNPDQQDACIEAMENVHPDLAHTMKSHGINRYTIHLDPTSNLLFGHLEYESDEALAAFTQTPACQEWWKEMSTMMPSNPDHSPFSCDLKEVFRLD